MYKIGVIGKREKVLCFMAAGFQVYDASDAASAAAALKKAKNEDCAIIYISPELAELIPDDIAKYAGHMTPAIIPLPTAGGGLGTAQLKHAVERAVGADIIFKDN